MPSPHPTPKRPRRTPGRPSAGSPSQRDRLIDAARERFASHGYAASSLRQIARDARVTPALAHYYFDDKAGLLQAVVEDRIAPLVGGLGAAVAAAGPGPAPALRAFIEHYTQLAARNPWLPKLVLREVLSDGGALREQFQRRFAGELAGLLKATIERGQAQGVLDAKLEPAWVAMTLISLCIFPFIAAPMVTGVLGISLDVEHAGALARHHLAVLTRGIGRLET